MIIRLKKRLEDLFTAAAFAEAGEFDTARKILKKKEISGDKRVVARKTITERLHGVK